MLDQLAIKCHHSDARLWHPPSRGQCPYDACTGRWLEPAKLDYSPAQLDRQVHVTVAGPRLKRPERVVRIAKHRVLCGVPRQAVHAHGDHGLIVREVLLEEAEMHRARVLAHVARSKGDVADSALAAVPRHRVHARPRPLERLQQVGDSGARLRLRIDSARRNGEKHIGEAHR